MPRLLEVATRLLVVGTLLAFPIAACGPKPLAGRVICVDPGHGGTAGVDSYRVGPGGEREEWIDLRVALLLRGELERRGARVVMTRTEDVAVELRARAELAVAARADVFLSVHHNATADPRVNLPIVYFHGNATENRAGVALARAVAARLNAALFAGRATAAVVSDLAIFPGSGTAVLRHSYGIPGVIAEASFFTNAEEERRLRDPNHNRREARALARALEEFLSGPVPPIEPRGSRVELPPFEVPREGGRMRAEALRWREDFELGRRFLLRGDSASLEQAYERLTSSARAFPDSPLAGECHRLRGVILARQGRLEEAGRERQRSLEHYPGPG